MSERNDKQCMRNFALKVAEGFLSNVIKFADAVPEVRQELLDVCERLRYICKTIREHNPPGDGRDRNRDKPHVRRIFVR